MNTSNNSPLCSTQFRIMMIALAFTFSNARLSQSQKLIMKMRWESGMLSTRRDWWSNCLSCYSLLLKCIHNISHVSPFCSLVLLKFSNNNNHKKLNPRRLLCNYMHIMRIYLHIQNTICMYFTEWKKSTALALSHSLLISAIAVIWSATLGADVSPSFSLDLGEMSADNVHSVHNQSHVIFMLKKIPFRSDDYTFIRNGQRQIVIGKKVDGDDFSMSLSVNCYSYW